FEKKEIKIIADKNPPYTLYIPFLIKIFPDARFIYIVRDYRDNVLSMKSVDFERPWLSSLAYRWKYYNKKFLKAYYKDKSRFHIIKYEDLVCEPDKYLTKLCSFLCIEYTDKMIHYNRIKDEVLKIYPQELIDRYHKNLFEPISQGNIGKWKNKMTVKEIRKCDMIVGKYADMMGYERMYKKKNVFLYISCLPGIIYGQLYYIIFDAATIILPYKLRYLFFKMLSGIFSPWWKKNYRIELDKSSLKNHPTTQE
ncbi:MAG: sulfotransferase, partial [Bacteroidota bacterium]